MLKNENQIKKSIKEAKGHKKTVHTLHKFITGTLFVKPITRHNF